MDRAIRVWDLATGACTCTLEGQVLYVTSVAITPDGVSVVSGSWDSTIRVWDLATGSCTQALEGHSLYVTSVALTSDGKLLVSGSRDSTIKVWDMAKGTCERSLHGHTQEIRKLAISPDGRLVTSWTADGMRVWPLHHEAEPHQARPPALVAQSKDGVLVEVLRGSDLQLLGSLVFSEQIALHTLCWVQPSGQRAIAQRQSHRNLTLGECVASAICRDH
ncbi:WD40 repeat-like protein [Haematococcus lacustris]|uniref:WD40 repeat-like protein n=1 Tax=Haematococcus lacustris TaxID=44745 RepID=A0A699Y9A7_HAELA|nr:WD40 repeat-like protein [Haematococcus lacustris]